MRIGNKLLDDLVATLRIAIHHAKPQRQGRKVFLLADQVAALVLKKRFAVGDEKLQIADLRPIDGRVVNLVDDSARQGEPDPADGGICGAEAVLVVARPARGDTGAAGRGILGQQNGHCLAWILRSASMDAFLKGKSLLAFSPAAAVSAATADLASGPISPRAMAASVRTSMS